MMLVSRLLLGQQKQKSTHFLHIVLVPSFQIGGLLWKRRLCDISTDASVRGALLAKGPDSSLGEVHSGSCSEDIHMEEEKVEVKVQEDEVEDGRDK